MMLELLREEYDLGVSSQPTSKRGKSASGLPLARACACLQVTRADLYRSAGEYADDQEMALRQAIQEIALEMPGYGIGASTILSCDRGEG